MMPTIISFLLREILSFVMENQYSSNSSQKIFDCGQLYIRIYDVSKSVLQKEHLLQVLKPIL